MTPIKNKKYNMIELQPPAEWDEKKGGECVPLPVCLRNGAMYSYWQQSEKEIAAVVAGHPVRLTVWGGLRAGHPPVMLDIEGL